MVLLICSSIHRSVNCFYREVAEAGEISLLENMTEHYPVITIRIKDCKGKKYSTYG